MKTNAILTVPPHAPFIEDLASYDIVSGVRVNTVMPTKGSLVDVLGNIKDAVGEKDVWIDLKGRQLRVEGFWSPPFTEIEVSHKLKVATPATAYFNDGQDQATILEVDGNKLIMQDGPRRVVGPGESLNILDPSLVIDGYLTQTDREYILAARQAGIDTFMLSYVESKHDIVDFLEAYGGGEPTIAAKIESKRGLDYVRGSWNEKHGRLMAARGDLYVEVDRPHLVDKAVSQIVTADPTAIVASRLFSSLQYSPEPTSADIGDAYNLLRMGYRTFMLGDETCMQEQSARASLNLLDAIVREHEGR